MQITHIASFLVSPGKNMENPPDVSGVMLPLTGRLYNMLNFVFENSDTECDIPIRFVMAEDGSQNNEARNNIIAFIDRPGLTTGKVLARHLRDFTTQRPGLALFFIILGKEGNNLKIVLSRFPADEGVVAEPHGGGLQVEYIERVFMKNRKYYKAALYQGSSARGDFWLGRAVDKQLNEIANYWIYGFLASDFETTSKEGTRRLAVALRNASKQASDIETKRELVGFTILTQGLDGQASSITDIMDRFNLSEAAKEILISQLTYQALANEHFIFDKEEFLIHAAFASIELNNGGILLAPPNLFNECFHEEIIDQASQRYRFTTEGQIVDETVRGRR